MNFQTFINAVIQFLMEREQRTGNVYKDSGALEHFHAGVDFAHRQQRSQTATALISILATLVVIGVIALARHGGFEQIPALFAAVGGGQPE